MIKTRYLIWHSPRTGSNLLCNMLHQTGVAGIKDYLNCGFPLGSIGETTAETVQEKLQEYELSQTTDNGVFGCKLSWEGLRGLAQQAGLPPVMAWLNTIDYHIYLYRTDTIAQAVSLYIAKERAYFSTTKTEGILPNPPYDYDQIAMHRRKVEMSRMEMETYFDDYKIHPLRICFETMVGHSRNLQVVVKNVVELVSGETLKLDSIQPQIFRQENSLKKTFHDRMLIDWDSL